MVSNATFAPFDKAGFFCWFAEAAKEFLDNNDCTNDLPILSLDHNDGVLNSPEHMAQTWEPLRGCSTFLTKGEKICEVVPVQSRDAGCVVHGIISALDDRHLVGCWVGRW